MQYDRQLCLVKVIVSESMGNRISICSSYRCGPVIQVTFRIYHRIKDFNYDKGI